MNPEQLRAMLDSQPDSPEKARNLEQLNGPQPEPSEQGPEPTKADVKYEKDMQKQFEDWLHHRGYWRRSPSDIVAGPPPTGWQLHLFRTQRNPIILDVLLLHNNGAYFECELKLSGRAWSSEEQRILCEVCNKPRYESFEDARLGVLKWERQTKGEE